MIEAQVADGERTPRRGSAMSRYVRLGADLALEYGIVLLFGALFVVLSIFAPNFLSVTNLLNIVSESTPLGLTACGMTLVIIAGGFDLSVGGTFALAGVASAWLALHIGVIPGMTLGVLFGLVLGLINGAIILGFRVHSFLATLATQLVYRAVATMITGGFYLEVTNPSFYVMGRGQVGAIQYTTIAFVVVAVLTWVLLARTTFGRHIYAVGGNVEAARLSGIRVNRVRIAAFVVCGFTAAFAGVLVTSQIGQGDSGQGVGLELQAIAAVVLGGTSILGGVGTIWRTLFGVGILGLLQNGFNLLGTPSYYVDITTGVLIIAAIAVNTLAARGHR